MPNTLPLQATFCAALLALSCAAHGADVARIAVVGDFDEVDVGQAGYCGKRSTVPRESWQKIFVLGDQRVWFRIKSTVYGAMHKSWCTGEYNFVPQAHQTYIVRYSFVKEGCHFELFRAVAGQDPVPESLSHSEPEVCFLK